MSNYTYSVVRDEDGDRNITIFIPGRSTSPIREDHPNWDDIFKHVVIDNNPDVDSLVALLDIAAAAAEQFNALSERVSIKDGRVFIDHDQIDNRLTRQILRFIKEEITDWQPLVNFFEKAATNPNPHSREMLGDWLAEHDFTITADGDIVGYKGVYPGKTEGVVYQSTQRGPAIVDGKEHKEGHVPNNIGSTIEVPRSYVQASPSVGCSTGLHIGTYSFARQYGTVLQVHVNPRDVVSVPTECSAQKMRCCRYVIVGTVDAKISDAVIKLKDDDNGPLNAAIIPAEPEPTPEPYVEDPVIEPVSTPEIVQGDEYAEGTCVCGNTPEWCVCQEDAEDADAEDDSDDEAEQFQTDEGDERDAEEDQDDDLGWDDDTSEDVFHPSELEFLNMKARAKTRRNNFVKYATKMGPWTLIGDPDEATGWSVPQDS